MNSVSASGGGMGAGISQYWKKNIAGRVSSTADSKHVLINQQIVFGSGSLCICWPPWLSCFRVSGISIVQSCLSSDSSCKGLVILGDVPGAQGSGSGTSGYYLLQFNSADGEATTRLRIGYTAMCCSLSDGPEHCAITVGKDHDSSIRF